MPAAISPASARLRSLALIDLQIEEQSAKARRGGSKGPCNAESDAPGSRGVVDLHDGVPSGVASSPASQRAAGFRIVLRGDTPRTCSYWAMRNP